MKRPTDAQLRHLGETLREIDPSTLQPDADGSEVRWFLGEDGTELYSWRRGATATPHHVQLVFSRVSVEWEAVKGLMTGTFKNATTTAGGRYDSYILTVGSTVDHEVCGAALVMLDATKIDTQAIEPLIAALRASVQWQVKTP